MSVERYISQLGEQGDFHSQGSFTIGWDKALEKLQTYKVGDPENYLVHLVTAGCAYGARNITINETKSSTILTMHDCYVSQADVQSGFHLVMEGSFQNPAFDLAQGLQSGLQSGFSNATLAAVHPQKPSYRIRLDQSTEQSAEPLEEQSKVLTQIVLKRPGLQGMLVRLRQLVLGELSSPSSLGGYVGMSAAARRVDERCDFSQIPITVNQQLVNRPVQLPRCPLAARVGRPPAVKFNSSGITNFTELNWSGALAFQAGPIRFVVQGLSFPAIIHPELTGVIWAEVDRDLSRQRILSDDSLRPFFRDLERIVADFKARD